MSLFSAILRPHDGTRRKVTQAVATSAAQRETARSRFEDTVRELLEVNDRLTGRNEHAASEAPSHSK